MRTDYEYIVVGLGGIGSGAAYWLARRAGEDVLGLEQFELGHDRGASQDHSRIIRLSYHTPAYVRLARQAYEAWAQLEDDAGEKLILKTGGLDLWPANAAIPKDDYTDSLLACGVPFEELEAAEVMERWPQWQLTDDVRALFQEDAGIAPASRCNEAHRRMASEHGAAIIERAPVTAIRPHDGEVDVDAGGTTYRCRNVFVAADAWTNDLLAPLGVKLPLTITQEQVTYFAAPGTASFAPERFPIWIWMDDPSFYGFPAYGEAGPKAAQDCGGREVTTQTRTYQPDPNASRRLHEFLERHLPTALGPVIETKTCLYTLTPDRDFVIDSLPEHPNVFVALGAAHAFKFSSLIGKIFSELAAGGRTDCDLEPFRIDRPILRMADPPRSWMI